VGKQPASHHAYVMGSADPEVERLIQQAHLFADQTRALLESAGLGSGMRALDVGCGPIGILDLLAEAVGPEGEVAGIDSSQDMVAAARTFAGDRGLMQVNVTPGDAAATGLPPDHFDFVHARLLLLHVAKPEALVAEMVRLCRPGGVVALHDIDADPFFCEPPHPAWDRLADAFLGRLAGRGIRPIHGRRTFGLLRAAGLEDVALTAFPELSRSSDPYRDKLITFVETSREQLVDRGFLSDKELDALVGELRVHLADPGTIVVGGLHYQAWGRKARTVH
jgi:SAM-dependent methyltransferase